MGICYAEKLVVPSSCTVMEKEEMMKVDGGVSAINIGMTQGYLNKTTCMDVGKGIIKTHGWKNVTSLMLAKEIYGHAVVYYKASVLADIPILDNAIYSHVANGVDLEDKEDRFKSTWNIV